MISTPCKECKFSDVIDSKHPCALGLIDTIKDFRTLEIKDNFYYIKDYQCRYGFSRKTYDANKDLFEGIDLINYIKTKILIKYYLVIDCIDDLSIKRLCQDINRLAITPYFISFLCYDTNSFMFISKIKELLNPNIKWKIHNFINKDMDHNISLKTALDTSHELLKCQFLWINRSSEMQYLCDSNAIEKINHIINIQQPVCNFIRSNKYSDDYLYGLLMNIDTYLHITKNINPILHLGVTQLENTTTVFYD